jgi:hypothetical protein
MSATRSTYFAHLLLICAALTYGPIPALAQKAGSYVGQAQEAQTVSGTSRSSDPASQKTSAPSRQTVICGPAHLGRA